MREKNFKVRHVKQGYAVSCGAAAMASIAGITEHEAIRECGTKKSGTSISDVCRAFTKRNIPFLHLPINQAWPSIFTHLKLLSNQYPIYVAGEFISNCGRGRNKHRHHAITLWDGDVYDPSEDCVLPMEAYNHVFNRGLEIKEIILTFFPE